jgi:hypothetical protein
VEAYTYYNLELSGNGVFNASGNITVNNNFSISGGGILNTSSNLTLNGPSSCGGSIMASGGTVTYNANAQQIIPGTYNIMENAGSDASLCGSVNITSDLRLNGGKISLGDYDLTLANGAAINPSVAFSAGNMIETNGSGFLVKESTTEAGFEILYPIGSGGYYNSMDLRNGLTATLVGTGSIKVKAVTGAQGVNFLKKYWEVVSNNLSVISNVHLLFNYDNAEVDGIQADYTPWVNPDGTTWITPDNPTAAGVKPFGSTNSGILDGKWTAGSTPPVPPVTWYAYASDGNWTNPAHWTLDGAANPDYVNPENAIPASSDIVVIPSGKKITIPIGTNNLRLIQIEVIGTIDIGTTNGHNFGLIKGNGTIVLSGSAGVDNFPAGNTTLFADPVLGGTVKINGAGLSLNTNRTYNNLLVDLTSGSATVLSDYVINGNLTIRNGDFKINNNSNTTPLNISVLHDVFVETNGTISVGEANAVSGVAATGYGNYHKYFHVFSVGGNFTNQGSVRLTNQNAPDYNSRTTNGAVSLVFNGTTHTNFDCQGITDLYYLVIDKGTDQAYSLTLNATDKAYFALFGDNDEGWNDTDNANPENRKALWIKAGTLILEGYVYIPTLTEDALPQADGTYTIGENAALVLNGEHVFVSLTSLTGPSGIHSAIDYTGLSYSTSDGLQNDRTDALYLYGTLIVNAGTLETSNSQGIVYRAESTGNRLELHGGLIRTGQFRVSAFADAGNAKMAYIQSGGEIKLLDNFTDDYAIFDLSAVLGTFSMSGGTISIEELANRNIGAIEIACNESNINVTGGSVIINNSVGTNRVAGISTTAPFHNFILRQNRTRGVQLYSALVLNANLQIEAENFNANSNDLTIGSDLIISSGATYTTGANTTTFNGSKESNLYLPTLQTFNNVAISKSLEGKNLVIASGLPVAMQVNGTFYQENGIFDYKEYTARLNGAIYLADTIGVAETTGKILINGPNQQVLTSNNGCIRNMEINNANNLVLDGDLNIIGTLTLTNGVFDINTRKLTMYGAEAVFAGSHSTTSMIQTSGNASDGGLLMYLDENETLIFPIGTNTNGITRYTPAMAIFSDYSDDGYIQIRPVDNVLATTNNSGGNVLSYYWRISHSDFTALPRVQYIFTYNNSDDDNNADNTFYPGKVLDNSPFTRSYENNLALVADTDTPPTIVFNGGGSGYQLENANYTAGVANRFTGSVRIFYTRVLGDAAGTNWTNTNNWTFGTNTDYSPHDSRQAPAGAYPTTGDIAYIGWVPFGDPNFTNGKPHGIEVNTGVNFSELRFTQMLDTDGNPTARDYAYNFQFRPTICINPGGSLNGTLISGEGLFWCRSNGGTKVDPNFNGIDLGGFVEQDSSYFIYESNNDGWIYNNIPVELPNLLISGDGWGANDRNFTISTDLNIRQDFELLGDVNLQVRSNISVGNHLKMIETTSPASGGGARIDYPNNASYSISILGDLKLINTGAIIRINAPNTTQNVSYLNVYGNITQDNAAGGGLQLYTALNQDYIKLSLLGEGNNQYEILSGAIANLYYLTLDKGTSQNSTFTFLDDFNLNGPTNGTTKALELLNGTLILDDTDISINLTTGGDDFAIPASAALVLNAGTTNTNGANSGILLDGSLILNGGTFTTNGTENNYIQYGASGNAKIEINSGLLHVGTQIRRLTTSSAGVLNYKQTGGEVLIGINSNGADYVQSRGILEVLNSGSSFELIGGSLTLVRQNGNNPEVAALYLDPSTYNLSGSTIVFGNANTPTAQNSFNINSSIPLNNLTINTDAVVADYPNINLATRPLTILGDLTINANATFDAKGLNLTLSGNLINEGTYTASNNTLIFSSNNGQNISGSGTYDIYRFTKTGSGTLTLVTNILVNDLLDIDEGTLHTDAYDLRTKGNVTLDGTLTSTSGNGIVFEGTTLQDLKRSTLGNSTMGIVTINNTYGIKVSNTGHSFTINNSLKLQNGVFNIGGSLLEFGENAIIEEISPFSTSNMIQTNSSFQDHGVKKNFPAGYVTDFIFPVGQLKYTPVSFNFSSGDHTTGTEAGYITVRPANEPHPSVNDGDNFYTSGDLNNVLQYYWILRADNLSGFKSDVTFKYEDTDALATEPGFSEGDYLAARILTNNNPEGLIGKFPGGVDPVAHIISFSFEDVNHTEIAGDYFAGIDAAIPSKVATYETIGLGGNINEPTTFLNTPAIVPPSGAILIVKSGSEVVFNVSNVRLYKTEIEDGATLIINETSGHRLGTVTGTGNIKVVSNTSNITFPAADFIEFFNCSGGGLEYGGSGNYSIMAGLPSVRNLKVSGIGTKELSNDIEICEDLSIDGPELSNPSNFRVDVYGNMEIPNGTFNSGTNVINVTGTVTVNGGTYNGQTGGTDSFGALSISAGTFNVGSAGSIHIKGNLSLTGGAFIGGTGNARLVLSGSTNQSVTGSFTGTNKMRNLEISNSSGATLLGNVTINNTLFLTNGVVTPGANTLLLESTATVSPATGTTASHINGKLSKTIGTAGSGFTFPTGKSGRLGYAIVSEVSAAGDTWSVEYFTGTATNEAGVTGFEPSSATIASVSEKEYWKITDGQPSGSRTAKVGLSWNSFSRVSEIDTEREKLETMVWNGTTWDNFGGTNFSAYHTASAGSFLSTSEVSFSEKIITLGTSDSDNPLPVTWLNFYAKANLTNVVLAWATASEKDNDYFDVERSLDGIEFTAIGRVYGAGNSLTQKAYSFTDDYPFTGTAYYRLKQVDFNGEYDYSKTIAVNFEGTQVFDDNSVVIYPNPFKDGDLTLELKSIQGNTPVSIKVSSLTGNMVYVVNLNAPEHHKVNLIPMAMDRLPQGIYFISISTVNKTITKRLIVN